MSLPTSASPASPIALIPTAQPALSLVKFAALPQPDSPLVNTPGTAIVTPMRAASVSVPATEMILPLYRYTLSAGPSAPLVLPVMTGLPLMRNDALLVRYTPPPLLFALLPVMLPSDKLNVPETYTPPPELPLE